ncbi:hypothetical protein Nepgr_012437 [Nepenthes gracilis]|uniref:Uncharacterized protein n=1 Tax=Nepenthes gracilis TaxID=150966 RepID=A0AAD3SGZ0_NEPGR|nr:hypothetical protein Nepgr_012437 [Nepenthes gracilis]
MRWSTGMMLRNDPLGRNAVGLLIDWVLSGVLLQLTPRVQECSGNEPLLPIVCQLLLQFSAATPTFGFSESFTAESPYELPNDSAHEMLRGAALGQELSAA